jgi:hypothetical protein
VSQLKYLEKNVSWYHFVYYRSHIDWLEIEPGPPWVSNLLPEPWDVPRNNWVVREMGIGVIAWSSVVCVV